MKPNKNLQGGRASRKKRLLEPNYTGFWGTSSADFARLIGRLYTLSETEALKSNDGNHSCFIYSAIPMLFSFLRCFTIECENMPGANVSHRKLAMEMLAKPNDIEEILKFYNLPDELRGEVELLNEIRNEIIHPAHLPVGTKDNWPEYLRLLKQKGLLHSTGRKDTDYLFFEQIASHRLLDWSCKTIQATALRISESYPEDYLRRRAAKFAANLSIGLGGNLT